MNNILKDQGRTATEDELQQFIQAADSNNDGKIQKKELYQLFKKVFKQPKRK